MYGFSDFCKCRIVHRQYDFAWPRWAVARLVRTAGWKTVDAELGLTTASKDGARLENFKVQDSRYGVTIPVLFMAQSVSREMSSGFPI